MCQLHAVHNKKQCSDCITHHWKKAIGCFELTASRAWCTVRPFRVIVDIVRSSSIAFLFKSYVFLPLKWCRPSRSRHRGRPPPRYSMYPPRSVHPSWSLSRENNRLRLSSSCWTRLALLSPARLHRIFYCTHLSCPLYTERGISRAS